MPVLGFRFGDIAYITDMNVLPDAEKSKLQGLEHVTLNTVSYHPHHSHFSLEQALDAHYRNRLQEEIELLDEAGDAFDLDAVRRGVNRAHILDGRIEHSVLIELLTDAGVGTMIY